MNLEPIDVARFWSKIDVKGVNECWLWAGAITHGYGKFQDLKAHRVAKFLMDGKIPNGQIVRHLCHNKRCCNPRHLEFGNPADNSQDEIERGNTMRGSRHGNAKLTTEDVIAIRASRARTIDLAKEYDVTKGTISAIKGYRTRCNG